MAASYPAPTVRVATREGRRNAILSVARDTFFKHGYGGTTMSAIAATLGGSKTTLWAYFPSKEALFAATIDDLVDKAGATFPPKIALDLRSALIDYCADFITFTLSSDVLALNRLIIAEVERFPELGRIFFEHGPDRRHRVVSAYLAGQVAAGNLKELDPRLAAAQLHLLCQGRLFIHNLWGVPGQSASIPIREEAESAVALFLDGYAS